MKPTPVAIAIVIALIAAVAITAIAAPRAKPGPPSNAQVDRMGHGFGFDKLARELGLTQEQTAQLKQLHEDFRTQIQPTREQIKVKFGEMVELWTVENPDPAAIKALAAEIDVLKDQIRDAAIDKMIVARNVLTPEQRAKLHEMIKNRPGLGMMLFGHGMGMRHGMGPRMGGPGMGPGGRTCPYVK